MRVKLDVFEDAVLYDEEKGLIAVGDSKIMEAIKRMAKELGSFVVEVEKKEVPVYAEDDAYTE